MTNNEIENNKEVAPNNKEALLVEYGKRFDYELNNVGRRWQMLTVFIALSGFSLAVYSKVDFKIILVLFNLCAGLCSIGYYIQVRSRAYDNAMRLKDVAKVLGIVGLAHIKKRENIIRFKGVSFYVIIFASGLTIGWFVILLSIIFGFKIP